MANYHDIRYDLALPTGASGAMIHIKTLTSDGSDSDLTFVDGASDVVLDNTYKTYIFKFTNIHPETDDAQFRFAGRDGGSNYDATLTTTFFIAHQREDDGGSGSQYQSAYDQCMSGELWLFNPSDTTFTTHFFSRVSRMYPGNDSMVDDFMSGYFNVTAAIDAIQFVMNTGEIQGGSISLWGIA
jgi:hypothetical protein